MHRFFNFITIIYQLLLFFPSSFFPHWNYILFFILKKIRRDDQQLTPEREEKNMDPTLVSVIQNFIFLYLNPCLCVDSNHSIHTRICTYSNQNSFQASFFIIFAYLMFSLSVNQSLHFFELDSGWLD